jgi:CRP-like cAMP-binding protein
MISTVNHLEDALSCLPRKGVTEYRRNQQVYGLQDTPSGLFLIKGRVKVTTEESGSETVIGIYASDQFFGAPALIGGHAPYREQATTMEATTLMTWSRAEIEDRIQSHPRLGLALMQILSAQCISFEERLQSLALEKTPERIVTCLLRLAADGVRQPDGAVRIPPMTHETLAGYIGTSREMVTAEMNMLRNRELLDYSRTFIDIHAEALTEYLRNLRSIGPRP